MQRFFVLGTHPQLSLAELYACFANTDFSLASEEVCVLDGAINTSGNLGGIIKSGDIVAEVPISDSDGLIDFIANLIVQKNPTGKINFGISHYSLDGRHSKDKSFFKLGVTVKKALKEHGISSRLVTSKEKNLSAVIVKTNKLLTSGVEICLVESRGKYLIGITDWVQPFEEYSRRDYGRPARDMKRGMLPPKLARMMVNLSNHQSKILLDPFCGSGTILMEAALLGGFDLIIGSDKDEKAIADTKTNLDWLAREFGVDISNIRLIQSRAEKIHEALSARPEQWPKAFGRVDSVVTEPYLGPPLSGRESSNQIKRTIEELKKLYIDSFQSLARIIKKDGRVVVALPLIRYDGEMMPVRIIPDLIKLGFELIDPLPASMPQKMKQYSLQGGIVYGREDQRVWREILVMYTRS